MAFRHAQGMKEGDVMLKSKLVVVSSVLMPWHSPSEWNARPASEPIAKCSSTKCVRA
jgi:hypothetical protein